jgi:hypothetical protein
MVIYFLKEKKIKHANTKFSDYESPSLLEEVKYLLRPHEFTH